MQDASFLIVAVSSDSVRISACYIGLKQAIDAVLIVDPETMTADTTTISGIGNGLYDWRGGVLANNGKIYGIPFNDGAVLIIDPETDTADTTTLTDAGSATSKFYGGVLASNGKIFGMPYNTDDVLVIDPGC